MPERKVKSVGSLFTVRHFHTLVVLECGHSFKLDGYDKDRTPRVGDLVMCLECPEEK